MDIYGGRGTGEADRLELSSYRRAHRLMDVERLCQAFRPANLRQSVTS